MRHLLKKWMTSATNIAPAQAAIKRANKQLAQNNSDASTMIDDEMDDINARLRDAYEVNEDAF